MIPETINFTGLSINARDLLNGRGARKAAAPYPSDWTRVEFQTDFFESKRLERIDAWLEKTIGSKWGSYQQGSQIVVMFESDDDAVLFKLMGGDTAWKQED